MSRRLRPERNADADGLSEQDYNGCLRADSSRGRPFAAACFRMSRTLRGAHAGRYSNRLLDILITRLQSQREPQFLLTGLHVARLAAEQAEVLEQVWFETALSAESNGFPHLIEGLRPVQPLCGCQGEVIQGLHFGC